MTDNIVGWDLETNSLKATLPDSRVLTSAHYSDSGKAAYAVEWKERDLNSPFFDIVDEELGDRTRVGVNVKFDCLFWAQRGGRYTENFFDLRPVAALLDEVGENSLESLARELFGEDPPDLKHNRKALQNEPLSEVLDYNLWDARMSYRLYPELVRRLKENNLWKLNKIYQEVSRVVLSMEFRGVALDYQRLEELREKNQKELDKVKKDLRQLTGSDINVLSRDQVADLVYRRLDCKIDKRLRSRKTGNASTGKAALHGILARNDDRLVREIVKNIMKARKLRKMESGFFSPYTEKHRTPDGRLYTSFFVGAAQSKWAGGTRTGRLSSGNPNLQQVPKAGGFRGVFVASPGYKLVKADYSQVEARLTASISGDDDLLGVYREGKDIHVLTAAQAHGKTYEELEAVLKDPDHSEYDTVKNQWRRAAKTLNYAVIYLVSDMSLLDQYYEAGLYDKKLSDARHDIEVFKESKKGWWQWVKEVKREVRARGEIVSAVGTKRHLPEAQSGNRYKRARAERQAVNFCIQSPAAVLMYAGLVSLQKEIRERGLDMHLLLNVHDDVLAEYNPDTVSHKEAEEVVTTSLIGAATERLKEFGFELEVPIAVDIHSNLDRWG